MINQLISQYLARYKIVSMPLLRNCMVRAYSLTRSQALYCLTAGGLLDTDCIAELPEVNTDDLVPL